MILTPKGQLSTNRIALLMLNTDFTNKLLRYRELHKLLNTYLIPIKENINQNNKLHSMFNQGITITGRLSSSNPINLQNIPSRTILGKTIRSLFITENDYKLCVADFSQIELRLIAHYSQDKNLINAYNNGDDIHEQTAKAIFRKESPTKDERFIGKTVNFAQSYGAGPNKLMETINSSNLKIKVTQEEMKDLLARFQELYSGINKWKKSIWYYTRHSGYIKTLLGRIIPICGFQGSWKDQSRAERESISYLIQGSAADIMKKSLIDVNNKYPTLRILATIHDELLFEIKNENIEHIKNIMEKSVALSIPLIVDIKMCNNWGEK